MISRSLLSPFLGTTLDSTNFANVGARYAGKVRDVYTSGERVILISTDRQSAFDYQWCTIPLKGQVLNHLSNWWFDKVKDVMPTHVTSVPDPNVTVARKLQMLKVEVVVSRVPDGIDVNVGMGELREGRAELLREPPPRRHEERTSSCRK